MLFVSILKANAYISVYLAGLSLRSLFGVISFVSGKSDKTPLKEKNMFYIITLVQLLSQQLLPKS